MEGSDGLVATCEQAGAFPLSNFGQEAAYPLGSRKFGVAPTLATARCAHCAGVLSEVVNHQDGSMARTPLLRAFAAQYGLRCITIADLIRYRTMVDNGQATGLRPASRLGPRAPGTEATRLYSAKEHVTVAAH